MPRMTTSDGMMNKQTQTDSISNVFIFRIISFNVFWELLRLRNSAWDFRGFCLESQGFFRIFAPFD